MNKFNTTTYKGLYPPLQMPPLELILKRQQIRSTLQGIIMSFDSIEGFEERQKILSLASEWQQKLQEVEDKLEKYENQ